MVAALLTDDERTRAYEVIKEALSDGRPDPNGVLNSAAEAILKALPPGELWGVFSK